MPARVLIKPCETCKVPAPPATPIDPAALFGATRTLPAPLPVAEPAILSASLRIVTARVPTSSELPNETAVADSVASVPTVTAPPNDWLPFDVVSAFRLVAPATVRLPSAADPPIAPPTAPAKVVAPPVVTARLRDCPAALATVPVKFALPEALCTAKLFGRTRLPKLRSPVPSARPTVMVLKVANLSSVAWLIWYVPTPPATPTLAPWVTLDSVALPLPITAPARFRASDCRPRSKVPATMPLPKDRLEPTKFELLPSVTVSE